MQKLTTGDIKRIKELSSFNINTLPLCAIEGKVQFMQKIMEHLLERTLELEKELEAKK